MKPFRLKLTHELLTNYGLYRKLEVYRPHVASSDEMARFHDDDYIDFLRRVTPELSAGKDKDKILNGLSLYNLGESTDCPVFDGLYEFCQKTSGGSIDAAIKLNHKEADIVINWSGGLHHAKKLEASGFCYVNDIVLCILELLKYYRRVVYIDIDIHHGDGVEEAFYTTNRVMTVSFHKYGDFFPGTGDVRDWGSGTGKYHSVNVPLDKGIDDDSYEKIFKPIMTRVMESYQPEAVVLQCGADSLTGDRLGCFNLTLNGHGMCVKFMKSFNVPLVLLGGGGYRVENVARCWTWETALALDHPIDNNIPYNTYFQYYGPSFKLHLNPDPNEPNLNPPKVLSEIFVTIAKQLSNLEPVPSVQFQDRVPDTHDLREARGIARDNRDPDVRRDPLEVDREIERPEEFYAGDKDNDNDPNSTRLSSNQPGSTAAIGPPPVEPEPLDEG